MSVELKLHQLECLVAVADHGSVRKAANYLGRSPTAVSNALRELELTVCSILVERKTEGAVVTDAGAALLAHARLILAQLQRAYDDAALLALQNGGMVRMAVTPWLMQGVLPHVIKEFRAQRPDVQLNITEHFGIEYPAVRSGQLDLAFGPRPDSQHDHALEVTPLYSYSYAVVCRQGHPGESARTVSDLTGYDWLLSRPIEHIMPVVRDLIKAQTRKNVCHFHYVPSLQATLAMIRSTDMLAIMPWPLLETPDLRHRFVALDMSPIMQESTTCLITRRYDPLQGPVLAFLDTFRRVARDLAASADPEVRRIFSMVESHM
ncbi:MAG TPA: LysR substrate-binding domain-containing protein [Bordetella sp.]